MNRFPDKSRVCFVGDSITHIGVFIKHIVGHYRKLFPGSGVEFYNCGIAGGYLGNTLAVFDEDIAIYDPTHIVLMIGVNDTRRENLSSPPSEERYAKLIKAYEEYQQNMEQFYKIVCERNIEFILCTPMPYAEYAGDPNSVLRGGYALVQGYAAYVKDFAEKHSIELCDFHDLATRYMQSEVLYDPDHVHPNARGHELMAEKLLSMQGIPFEATYDFSPEMNEWYDITQKLRNIVTAEYFTIPDFVNLTAEERLAFAQKQHDDIKAGRSDINGYFASLIESYIVDKPRQSEYIEHTRQFMKSN